MRASRMLALLGAAFAAEALGAACTSPYSSEITPLTEAGPGPDPNDGGTTSLPPSSGTDAESPFAECPAQRTVHILAGNGGFAWFTLLWPLPPVITAPTADTAYDDVTKAASVGTTGHPLYVRKVGSRPLWEGTGSHPMPSAFVAGSNQTHTNLPTTTRLSGSGTDAVVAGAEAQKALTPLVPVLSIAYQPSPATGVTVALKLEDAIAALKAKGMTAAQEAELQTDANILASWGVDTATSTNVRDLATRLLFAANAFRLGLVGTVLLPGTNDDPHGAFTDVTVATTMADRLTRILDGFYTELAKSNEPRCGHGGKALSLADNVVTVVSGDTPKNSFARSGWPDGTAGNSNLLYVRANGWLVPGWFGSVTSAARTNFDPDTGQLSGAVTATTSTNAALAALLFAIARGNVPAVTAATSANYAGLVSPTPP
ncbi:MAG: hypothetical protein JST00_34655 [Deltaproteobacteria bacterium]|nr:hypothetical protein [Deltaproteobacteria bacterium]